MQRVIVFSHAEAVDLLSRVIVNEVEAMTGVVKTELAANVFVENGEIVAIVRHRDRHVHLLLDQDNLTYGKKV